MHLFDKLTVDSTRRTTDGYLAVNARVARAGNVQTYLGREVGKPHLGTVRIYRPEAEVFNKDTLASFTHRPITLGHPSSPVTSDNWHAVAKGWSDGEVARDGEFIRVSMLLADAEAIRAVEGGTRELSAGYDCELIWEDGTSPSGERYDAKQVSIRGNHVAIVAAARGGTELRIGDSAMETIVDARTGMIDQAIIDAEAHARRLRSLDKLTSLAESMAAFLEKARNEKDRERKLAALARDKRNLCLGEEYYREIERIKDASGIRAADARIGAAKGEICRLGESIMAIPPSSVACLTMKAEAVEVWFETMFPGLKEETSFVAWPIHMARDIRNVVLGGVS